MENLFKDERLNYKDVLIILFTWSFLFITVFYLNTSEFADIIIINDFLAFMLKTTALAVFTAVFYSYFNLIYDLSLKDLGFDFKNFNFNISLSAAFFVIFFISAVLITYTADQSNTVGEFNPVYRANSLKAIMSGFPLIMIILISTAIISAAEMFLVNKVIFALFDLKFPSAIASVLTALFFPIMLLEFRPNKILILFLAVLTANYIYRISKSNLLPAVLFYTAYLTNYIIFIYGYDFLL
ncbi:MULTISPECIES: hypothetical protein [unclassified Halanaerobium]|uniref:hypothetical protein n=1 Tax=unclassified Halanaerobium TaxID=2641197 RepID=UPI000DF12F2D|nr:MULTISPECIES: hypothetical protein [unclassified Halanaerobium]RCW49278.1 hypothetical protein DFR78_10684 [Halanaerobium sp. MA284_MarDTE_T2]RCW84017.1 hypothetical protein DER71_11542 [Halanaerobium sp. DL-01]